MIYSALQTLKEHLLLNHVCFTHPTEDISTIRYRLEIISVGDG